VDFVFFDGFDVHHDADVVVLELREHPVEDLKVFPNFLTVFGQRAQTLFTEKSPDCKTSKFETKLIILLQKPYNLISNKSHF